MKILYRNRISNLAVAMMFLFAGTLITGCYKEKEAEVVAPTGDGNMLVVSVLGVADVEEILPTDAKANAAGRAAVKDDELMPNKMVNTKGFDALLEVERNAIPASKVVMIGSKASSAGTGQRAAAVPAGVKYRLFLYKSDGSFYSSTLLTSGQAVKIPVDVSTKYTYYALSYNNKEDVPDISDRNTPSLALPGNRDVLYATGTVDVPAAIGENTALGITFNHSLARVGVEINTMGMFADMENLGVTVSGLTAKTATINLKTGALSNPVTYEPALDFASFGNVEEPYADAKIAYIYTAEVGTSNVVVTLNKLQLKIDDGTSRSFDQLLSATPSTFTFNSVPRQLGASFTARVNMIESPLTLGNVRWARQNLYYVNGHNPYRFQHTYAHTNARNTYFSFRGLVPESFGTNSDPCAQVYPSGTWRQPTVSEISVLANAAATYGDANGLGYFEYTAAGTAAPYPGNNLRLNMNGRGNTVSVVENLVKIDLGSTYGTAANYWSSSALLDVGPLLVAGARSFDGTRVGNNNVLALGENVLNIGLLSIGVLESDFRNVRCVRR